MYKFNLTVLFFISFTIFSFGQSSSLAESVEYDPVGNRFLSSSQGSSIIESDPEGNLSYFGSGLRSSLGMEIIGNHLFCIYGSSNSDLKNIRVYDLTTERLVTSHKINNAQILNGMASDGVSKIWVTDYTGSGIFELDFSDIMNPIVKKIVYIIPAAPNGITYDKSNNRLVFVSWDDATIRQVDLTTNSVSNVLVNSGITNMDGIDMDADDNFYVSSWAPDSRITKYSNDFSTSEIIDVPGINQPADICIAKEINMLAIPSGQHNVILFPLPGAPSSLADVVATKEVMVNVFPNPSNGLFNIEVLKKDWKNISYNITDMNGKLIQNSNYNHLGADPIKVDLSKEPGGFYIINFLIDGHFSFSEKVQITK